MTPAGRDALAAARPRVEKAHEALAAELGDARRRRLHDLLLRFLRGDPATQRGLDNVRPRRFSRIVVL
ncbi:MAG TPA: hypothetical protein VK360_00410 [Acidimicrobiales bacterium]|nr:hypothetical protein [Acidimicrobiales bacterium]